MYHMCITNPQEALQLQHIWEKKGFQPSTATYMLAYSFSSVRWNKTCPSHLPVQPSDPLLEMAISKQYHKDVKGYFSHILIKDSYRCSCLQRKCPAAMLVSRPWNISQTAASPAAPLNREAATQGQGNSGVSKIYKQLTPVAGLETNKGEASHSTRSCHQKYPGTLDLKSSLTSGSSSNSHPRKHAAS